MKYEKKYNPDSTAQHRLDYRIISGSCQVFFGGLGVTLCHS